MSPKPYTPDDEMLNNSDANAPVKKTKGGNAQKRIDYFMQQRFPSLVTSTEDVEAGMKRRGLKKKATIEQQAAIAPLARIRVNMMQEYKRRLLRQRQELENAATKQPPAADDHE